jgi:hypothetical protein
MLSRPHWGETLCLAVVVAAGTCLYAQDSQTALHAADGNARMMITSIVIPPKPGAPFSATVHADWKRELADGTTLDTQNRRLVVRDSAGRIYQERRMLQPNGDSRETLLTRIEISDPARHIKYFCNTQSRICELRDYYMSVSPPTAKVGIDAEDNPNFTQENLGKDVIGGLEVIGTRETFTAKPGAGGTGNPIQFTKEFWYSPQLDLNLTVKRIDPLNGTQSFSVTDINLSEPDVNLFKLPAGYKVVDARVSKAKSQTKPTTE